MLGRILKTERLDNAISLIQEIKADAARLIQQHAEAQALADIAMGIIRDRDAEIARLQAEVERLTDELTASCARAELQQREAERLRINNGVLHDAIENIFEEGAKQLARANTAWNDAIEAAAQAANDYDNYALEEVIRALKRTTSEVSND